MQRHGAESNRKGLFTAKDAKDAEDFNCKAFEKAFAVLQSFASFASFAVKDSYRARDASRTARTEGELSRVSLPCCAPAATSNRATPAWSRLRLPWSEP